VSPGGRAGQTAGNRRRRTRRPPGSGLGLRRISRSRRPARRRTGSCRSCSAASRPPQAHPSSRAAPASRRCFAAAGADPPPGSMARPRPSGGTAPDTCRILSSRPGPPPASTAGSTPVRGGCRGSRRRKRPVRPARPCSGPGRCGSSGRPGGHLRPVGVVAPVDEPAPPPRARVAVQPDGVERAVAHPRQDRGPAGVVAVVKVNLVLARLAGGGDDVVPLPQPAVKSQDHRA
jgi:hypothetical protein